MGSLAQSMQRLARCLGGYVQHGNRQAQVMGCFATTKHRRLHGMGGFATPMGGSAQHRNRQAQAMSGFATTRNRRAEALGGFAMSRNRHGHGVAPLFHGLSASSPDRWALDACSPRFVTVLRRPALRPVCRPCSPRALCESAAEKPLPGPEGSPPFWTCKDSSAKATATLTATTAQVAVAVAVAVADFRGRPRRSKPSAKPAQNEGMPQGYPSTVPTRRRSAKPSVVSA